MRGGARLSRDPAAFACRLRRAGAGDFASMRIVPAVGRAAFAMALASLAMRADTVPPLRFAISFPAARSAKPLDGRVLLFISDDGRTEPASQSDQYRANSTRPIFGVDVDGLDPGRDVIIDDKVAGWPARNLKDVPPGVYWVQALLN